MSDELTVLASPKAINVINPTARPVLLTSVESPDVPEWILRPTGLETEAQPLNPGESWKVNIGTDLSHAFFHVEVEWIDEGENRRTRTVRLNP